MDHLNNHTYSTPIQILIIIIIILVLYIIYHIANCSAYKYAYATINKIPENILEEQSKIKCTNVCNGGRPRCDIYQSNSENYINCVNNNLGNYIDCECNKNQFSFTN